MSDSQLSRLFRLQWRLDIHQQSDELGEPPLLLLDDVLSELDADRARVLLATLPPGQTIITSASELPAGTVPDQTLRPGGTGFVST